MPPKNRTKDYIRGAYYHIYARGVNKRKIFLNQSDYKAFLYRARSKNRGFVEINAYCLMPNHYHLLVQNKIERGIEKYMRSLNTSYALFFNRKYDRVGHLFQGRYQAALIKTDAQLAATINYIHQNPYKDRPETKTRYPYSSERNHTFEAGPSSTRSSTRQC